MAATTPLAVRRRNVSYTFGCGIPVRLDSAYPVSGSRASSPTYACASYCENPSSIRRCTGP